MSPQRDLVDLLLRIFSGEELRRNLRYLPEGESLLADLPGASVSPRVLASECVVALGRRGWGSAGAFWAMLRRERPHAAAEIAAIQRGLEGGLGASERGSRRADEALRILFVSASPEERQRLRCDQELREISERLRGAPLRDRITWHHAPAARFGDLRTALLEFEPHILHLSCHGSPDGRLFLEGEQGEGEPVPAASFALLLQALAGDLRLGVFMACHSAALARSVNPPLPLSVGFEAAIPDDAARRFAVGFYETLAFGKRVEQAFGAALADLARVGLEAAAVLLPAAEADLAGARASRLVGRGF